VLCDPTYLVWKEGIPFEATTGRAAFIDGLLDEIFPGIKSLSLNHYLTVETDVTLGAIGHWLGTKTSSGYVIA
jgi:hypothetical protein